MIPPVGTPLSASWKVPFRQVYCATLAGCLRASAECAWLTLAHRAKALLSLPTRSALDPE